MKGEEMRIVPIVHCTDVEKSLTFYTGVLDFKKKHGEAKDTDWVIDLVQGDAEIQLSQHAGDGAFGCAINVRITDVDGLFNRYLERLGLLNGTGLLSRYVVIPGIPTRYLNLTL